MNDWTPIRTLQHGNVTIVIHRSVLADGERAAREQQVQSTMTHVMREYIKEEHHEQ